MVNLNSPLLEICDNHRVHIDVHHVYYRIPIDVLIGAPGITWDKPLGITTEPHESLELLKGCPHGITTGSTKHVIEEVVSVVPEKLSDSPR